MQTIDRQRVETMLDRDGDVVLIEVLPEAAFRKKHLPGAVNVPVGDEDFDDQVAELVPDKGTPIIVYCQDEQCQASPKAAKRLDELGYQKVYDYEAGKDDWEEAGNEMAN